MLVLFFRLVRTGGTEDSSSLTSAQPEACALRKVRLGEKSHSRINDHSPASLIHLTDSCGVKTQRKRMDISKKSVLGKERSGETFT